MNRRFIFVFLWAAFVACTSQESAAAEPVEHAVIVHFENYGSTNLDALFALENRLKAAIEAAKAGEYDGNEIAADGTDGTLYMYGNDADRLFAVVKPILAATKFTSHATVVLRYGPPKDGVRQVVVRLGS